MRGFQQVGAPDHMSEIGLSVINSGCKLVGVKAVATLYDEVFGRSLGKSRLFPPKPVAKSLQPIGLDFHPETMRRLAAHVLVLTVLTTTAIRVERSSGTETSEKPS